MIFATLLAAAFGATAAQPSAAQISAALDLLKDCDGPAVTELLSRADLQRLELQLQAARHAPILHSEDAYWTEGQLLKQWRAQAAPPTLQQIYRDQCMSFPHLLQLIAKDIRPVRSWVHSGRAWVPLVAVNSDYFGLGLSFVQEAGQWRLTEQVDRSAHIQVRHPAHRHLWESLDAQAGTRMSCFNVNLPPPPEPREMDLEAAFDRWMAETADTGNVWGYLQRQAIAHHAGARAGATATPAPAASASAQALWAQVLYSSLSFDNAPDYASAAWDRRLVSAMGYAQRAINSGIDARGFTPISLALAKRHLFHPDLPQRDAAQHALLPALAVADIRAQILQALMRASSNGDHEVDCSAAVEGLMQGAAALQVEDDAYNRAELLQLAARIDLDCPIAAARQPQRALQHLQALQTQLNAKDLQALRTHAHCLLSESGDCVLPSALKIASAWDAEAARREILEPIRLLPARDRLEWQDCDLAD